MVLTVASPSLAAVAPPVRDGTKPRADPSLCLFVDVLALDWTVYSPCFAIFRPGLVAQAIFQVSTNSCTILTKRVGAMFLITPPTCRVSRKPPPRSTFLILKQINSSLLPGVALQAAL